MSEHFSDAWFDDLETRLTEGGPLTGSSEVSLRLGQVVTAADGTQAACWTLELEGGSVPVLVRGSVEAAEVTLVSSAEDAKALASGERTAAQLLEAGLLKIRGDARRLAGAGSLIEAVSGRFG